MGQLTFQATLGGAVNLAGPNTASTTTFTLPAADGTSGQVLQTNGSGTLSFGNPSTLLVVPTSDGTSAGPTCNSFVCGYSSSAIGDLVYLDSNSKWQKCDANTTALYNGFLGIAMAVAAADATLLVALPGSFVYATGFPTLTVGSPVYMSETPGAVTQTAPTTTDSATRVVGWAIHADKIYFFPSPDYITHT